jgi:hypothetical protein
MRPNQQVRIVDERGRPTPEGMALLQAVHRNAQNVEATAAAVATVVVAEALAALDLGTFE